MWRRVIRDASVFAGAALVMAALQAAYRFVAITELSKTEYGKVALLITIFNVALVLGVFGLPTAGARLAARCAGVSRDRKLLTSLVAVGTGPGVAATAVIAGATLIVTRSAWEAAFAAAGMPPMALAVVISGFLRGKGAVLTAASVQPLNALVQLLVLGGFVLVHGASVASVMGSFYIGNAAAFAYAFFLVLRHLRTTKVVDSPADQEAHWRRVIAFTGWLTASNVAILSLTLVPRVGLAHISYADVAVFDLALTIYTIPQRLTSSLVIAVVPFAARVQKQRSRVTVPSAQDVASVALVVAAVDVALWRTHLLKTVLSAVGLHQYVRAEPILLILLLAAPAELVFASSSALLQAFGRSRRIAIMTAAAAAALAVAVPFVLPHGAVALAALLALAYWGLAFASSAALSDREVETRRMIASPGVRLRRLASDGWITLRSRQPRGAQISLNQVRGYYIDFREKTVDPASAPLETLLPADLAQTALGWWERHLGGDPEARAWFHQIATLLATRAVERGGELRWPYPIRMPKYGLEPGWCSALAQAQAASVFVRAASDLRDARYGELARRAVSPLLAESDITASNGVGRTLEEYPSRERSTVLNGWIFALWGLFDVALALQDREANSAFEEGVKTLRRSLSAYDIGWWSRYSVYPHPLHDLAKPSYHRLHVEQLEVLYKITGDRDFSDTARRWLEYDGRAKRVGVLAQKSLFRLTRAVAV